MARPRKAPPRWVYRVRIDRPERKDSRILWLTMTPEEIRKKYGWKVLNIDRYGHERGFNAKG